VSIDSLFPELSPPSGPAEDAAAPAVPRRAGAPAGRAERSRAAPRPAFAPSARPATPALADGLDFAADDARSGFRLQRLEVLNWGTFDARVWSLQLDGRNALLTGDIGSGKSTLVDAVTTLLVPAHRIAYNKAAGAEARERTLRSYVLGHYKSERHEGTGASRPVSLRDGRQPSVILGVFHNAGYDQTVTLAQVFWLREPQAPPARLYVTAERALTIAHDFAGFGADIAVLRRRLRAQGAEVEDAFARYGAWFRRRFGIDNEQALELFLQTVSMKSVGNLTDFVRTHMLEPFDVAPRIDALIVHFDDLRRAHEAVLKAKDQVERLAPLVADGQRHAAHLAEIESLRSCRDLLAAHFAALRLALLERRLQALAEEADRLAQRRARRAEQRDAEQAQVQQIERAVSEQGGDRLAQLEREIREHERERDRRQQRAQQHAALLAVLAEPAVADEADFLSRGPRWAKRREALADQEAQGHNRLTESSVVLRDARQAHARLSEEIDSLQARRSNIPRAQVALRQALCAAVGVDESAMPFAGELIQVREDALAWEGAAERVLHGFGLSLLVPDAHYADVAAWVDRTALGARLVYFRCRPPRRTDMPEPYPQSLLHKLALRTDSPLHDWLERELAQRFDLACCDSTEQFRRETRALTRTGQVKAPGERHEKDDRHRLDDRSRYVLGWSNEAKLAALQAQRRALERQIADTGAIVAQTQREVAALRRQLEALAALAAFGDWTAIDWGASAAAVARLRDEHGRLEAASDTLRELSRQLELARAARRASDEALDALARDLGGLQARQEAAQAMAEQARSVAVPVDDAVARRIEALREQHQGGQALTVESCEGRERALREQLQAQIDTEGKRLERAAERIIKAMSAFKDAYKLDTAEVDASLEALPEYRGMLERLRADDLPRFEGRFKELLNVNTINEIAQFNAQLARERETIRDRIARINESLTQIDYNTGRYIVLESQVNADAEIRDFQAALRACTEGALTGSDDTPYAEAKFLQVRAIIDRFRGRDGLSDLDRRWTAKVTDVRQWFAFAASERWREDGTEHEHYADSGGKSGGQKEKLAYTILAASLAYQFGLEWGAVRSRSFRFVVIDEAFGRGSDESAQYGLRLFRQLNLQLLIVTPLQKIPVIEPFVSSVGFVLNPQGRASMLRNLTIEAYRAGRDAADADADANADVDAGGGGGGRDGTPG